MQLIPEQSSPSEEYLSDYAYIDAVRLSHYYGQLSEHGLITQSKRTFKKTGKDTGKLDVKALVVTGGATTETGVEDWLELQSDSSFSRPQQSLDALYDAGFIRNGLKDARVGSLVLIKGNVSIFDIRLLKDIWHFAGNMLSQTNTAHITNLKERQRKASELKKENETIAQVISKLPHSVQGTFAAIEGAAWFTLKPECMLINPEDIVFKHGCDLEGEWHMLGIVDALPADGTPAPSPAGYVDTEIEGALRGMLAGLRVLLGRPPERFGITPIMIFRTMKKDETPLV